MINENAGRRLGVDKQKVMDKVRKCLALSKSATGNEAAVALRQAQALMAKHGLTDEHVELSQVVSATAKAGWGISAPQYMVSLVNLVERVFGVIAVFQGWGSRTHAIEYFGIGCQPEIAAYVSDVLRRQLRQDREQYMKTLKRLKRANKSRMADLYAESWVYAAAETVGSFTQSNETRALIRRGMKQNLGSLDKAAVRAREYQDRDYRAAHAGMRDGRNVRLHQATGFDARPSLTSMA